MIRWRKLGQERISQDGLAHLAKTRPYDITSIRHILDQSAYNIYGHWLQQREIPEYGRSSVEADQSHAMLFENSYKILQERLAEIDRKRRLSQKQTK